MRKLAILVDGILKVMYVFVGINVISLGYVYEFLVSRFTSRDFIRKFNTLGRVMVTEENPGGEPREYWLEEKPFEGLHYPTWR